MGDQTRGLQRSRWQAHLDELTRQHEGHDVTIELLDQQFGDEAQVEKLPLAYVEFDPKDDVVIVAVGGRDSRYPVVLRHMIDRPQHVVTDTYGDDRRVALAIVDGDGDHTIVAIEPPAPP